MSLDDLSYQVADEEGMRRLGGELGKLWRAGDVVFLFGELGAGKTTLVRGLLESLGVREPVRSPTFNLIQIFATEPPVLHADLYRVKSFQGIGIEDYLDTHLILIEWPDRAAGLVPDDEVWKVEVNSPTPDTRAVTVTPPSRQV